MADKGFIIPTERIEAEDFMFQLDNQDVAALRSQIVTLKSGRGEHSKYPPYAFIEQGVAMLSSVLNSERPYKSISRSCGLLLA